MLIRFVNGLTLAIFLSVSFGLLFTLNKRASADIYGTDCVEAYFVYPHPNVHCDSIERDLHYSGTSCSTSPSGKCCTYDAYNAYCPDSNQFTYNYYELQKAGEAGKTCVDGKCQ